MGKCSHAGKQQRTMRTVRPSIHRCRRACRVLEQLHGAVHALPVHHLGCTVPVLGDQVGLAHPVEKVARSSVMPIVDPFGTLHCRLEEPAQWLGHGVNIAEPGNSRTKCPPESSPPAWPLPPSCSRRMASPGGVTYFSKPASLKYLCAPGCSGTSDLPPRAFWVKVV